MIIRDANLDDSDDIYNWRNDKLSREMFFDSSVISKETHDSWFKKTLNSNNNKIYIGEKDNAKIGVCRFEKNKNEQIAEVSININPNFRGKGLSSDLLNDSINFYLKKNYIDLNARVKNKNEISQKIFKKVGFYVDEINKNEIKFLLPKSNLKFEKITETHTDILYDLLKKRKFNISHKVLPDHSEHAKFVKNHPYVHWYLIVEKNPIGTFYIQKNNSIGLNLEKINKKIVNEVLRHIEKNFKPQKSIPSSIPSYFYINIPIDNLELQKILENLELVSNQKSYKF